MLPFLFMSGTVIRIVPEWNVKKTTYTAMCREHFIRIVPEWNVKEVIRQLHRLKNLIRIVPEWNVKCILIGYDSEWEKLESYQSGM